MQKPLIEKRPIAISAIIALAVSGVFGFGAPAYASTAAEPTIIFDGNTLATSAPATETATRVSADSLRLSTESLSRTITSARSGYTFGGWALTRGGPATTEITTATTSDTTRTLHAVWNTTINFGTNFADSGTLPSNKISETYRFGQSLVLPTAGTLVKAGYAFGGWMTTTISTNRFTTYTAAALDNGNPTVYVAWIKTVTFNANGATTGVAPTPQTYVAGGTRLALPTASNMTLRRAGYDFVGWSTTATGSPVTGPTSYVPLVAQQTLFAIWQVQSTKAATRVFFNPGKSTLRATQKLVLRDLIDSLRGKSNISVTVVSRRAKASVKSLGKARNTAVVRYLKSQGVNATFARKNNVSSSNLTKAKKVNRVTVQAVWTNPIQ
jgi:uncharacterized repeat protein (TIGR02543 family)